MEEHICEKFTFAIETLEETYCVCDEMVIRDGIESAKALLLSTYSELLKDVYYANLICKELYCKIRENRDCAVELLCCALEVLDDQGGKVDPFCFGEVDDMIRESICYIEKAKVLLCEDCCEDSCNSASCESSCSASCDSSSLSCSDSCSDSCDSSSLSCSDSCSSSLSCSTSCDSSSLSCSAC